jgi:hypothetical protein
MLKRLCLAFAGLFVLATVAQGAGTVPGFSLVPQFDLTGKIAPGCKLFVIQAGTGSTPQNAYQDSSLTLLQPNPMLCDAAGRLPQWFVADGSIKLRLTDKNGVQIFTQDGLLVVGASSGGGGGSPVDPTTILQTGQFITMYGTGILTGFVRANGRTIGSATSGATERANADCSALFQYLWGADANLAVSGGRGASAAADWSANKTITLPDLRGRTIAGLDDMGNTAAGRLTATYFGTAATVLGAPGGSQSHTLSATELPTISSSGGPLAVSTTTVTSDVLRGNVITLFLASGGGTVIGLSGGSGPFTVTSTGTTSNQGVLSNNTGNAPHSIVPPTMLTTFYVKL